MNPKVRERPPEHRLMAQALVRDVSRSPDDTALYASASKQISVSVPLSLLARLEVLAGRGGQARGSMVVGLMRIALDVVFEEMPPELQAEIDGEIAARESELYSEFNPQEAS